MKALFKKGKITHGYMGTINQYNLIGQYETALGGQEYGPCFDSIWIDVPSTRGWAFQKGAVKKALDKIIPTGRTLNVSLGFKATDVTNYNQAHDDKVAAGFYDMQIRELAMLFEDAYAAGLILPIILRIGGEINGSWQGNHKNSIIAAIMRVVDAFKIYSPRTLLCVCFEPNGDKIEEWLPSNLDGVDLLGIDLFGAKDFAAVTRIGVDPSRLTHSQRNTHSLLTIADSIGIPVFLGEVSPIYINITSTESSGKAAYRKWFEPFFKLLGQYPIIQGIAMGPVNWDNTNGKYDGWGDSRFHNNLYLLDTWKYALKASVYGRNFINISDL